MGHPSGLPEDTHSRSTCGDCAWAHRTPNSTLVCLAAAPSATWDGPAIRPDDVSCAWFEPPVHCDPCGACCREAFDSVPLASADDPTAERHPDFVQVADDGWRDLKRVPSPTGRGTRCAALRGDGAQSPYRCVIYADRPSPCRDLMPNTPNCLFARRRVGLSQGTS